MSKHNILSAGMIGRRAVYSSMFEASCEKPGNVTPSYSFSDAAYHDFVVGARALFSPCSTAAFRGISAGKRDTFASEVGLGGLVLKSILGAKERGVPSNTHLGSAMLLVPLSAAAGMRSGEGTSRRKSMRRNIRVLMNATRTEDALALFDAIRVARPGGLGRAKYDASSERSKDSLKRNGITFQDVMALSAGRDSIAGELSGDMRITFETALPVMENVFDSTQCLETAVIQSYLTVLAIHPDTLIARKAGRERAERVSRKSAEVLGIGGILTPEGREAVARLNSLLRDSQNSLNPGTTADIVTAALFVLLLEK